MTIVYRGSLLRLLFKWRGSLYKCIGLELLIFFALFMLINFSYRFAMTEAQKRSFEALVGLTDTWMQRVPLQFFLGFYVSYILGRWWGIITGMPVPDKALLMVTTYFPGNNDEDRSIRQSIARWLNLHCVLTWRQFAMKIYKRFPEDTHLIQSGLMSPTEYDVYRQTTAEHGRWWQPIQWCTKLISRQYESGVIPSDAVNEMVNAIYEMKGANGMLLMNDWVLPPLIYTQLAALATYGYFALCLLARQTVKRGVDSGQTADLYIPVVTLLEFLFFVGWLKVADVFREPFGEEDDDFDINYWLDRNIHTSNMIIDEVNRQNLDTSESPLWRSLHPKVPHTRASFLVRDGIPKGRLEDITFSEREKEIITEKHTADNVARRAFEKSKFQASQAVNKARVVRDKYGNRIGTIGHKKDDGKMEPFDDTLNPLPHRRHSLEL